ncbi:restriction endonuclease subunit S [Bifidobacterium adolescentis]|nr:restriction endonuclease subunit S [Bifidobacterium adolescentis]
MAEQHEKALVPQIRFTGFTDPWEQRKLGEVARRVTRKNENGDSDLPLTISAQYGLVDQRTFFNSQVASKDMSGYFLLHRGEFAYNKSTSTDSPWGAIKRLEKYDMGCVSTLYICFELLSGDPDFLVTYYETDRWYKSVQLIAAEGARNHGLLNIAPDDFFETQICIPKRIDEQRRIGAFFDRLDSLITLHQRKYDKLCVLKKSMLDKMFPKGGSLYPEIRFAGFTDPWEQRKLDEVASKRIEKNTNEIKETFTNSAEHGIVSQLDYFDHDITNDANIGNYSVVYPDDFVYNPRISTIAPCGPINRNKLGRNGVMSPLYTVFSVDDVINKLYLEYYFKTNSWHQFMFLEGNSGARSDRFSISDSTFFEMPIQCPVLEEQELIASFFNRLDSLITLHQRKLELLRNIKKSMLDKMFV